MYEVRMRFMFVDNMSATDDDNELRGLLVQTLESNGTLAKVRAQLRASVFLALEKQEPSQNKAPLLNAKLKAFLNTKDGRLAAGLVQEFFEFFDMEYTEVVFDAESGLTAEQAKRDILLSELNLPNDSVPVLSQAIKSKSSVVPNGLSNKCIAEARRKFDQYDMDDAHSIEKADVTSIFCELFPDFHRSILEKFVQEECRDAEKGNSHRYLCLMPKDINFDEFLTMYKHLFEFCKRVVLRDTFSEDENDDDSPTIIGNSKFPIVNNTPDRGLNNHIGSSLTKLDGSGITNKDSFGLNTGVKSPESQSYNQHSPSRSSLLPSALEDDPFFDDPFLPASSGLKTFGREMNGNETNIGENESSLYEAKPVTVVPVQSSSSPALQSKTNFSNKENTNTVLNTVISNLDKKVGELKFDDEDAEDDDDYDDDFHSEEVKTPRSEGQKSLNGGSLNGGSIIEEELEADDLLRSEESLADLTTDKTVSQSDGAFDYMEEIQSS